MRETGITIITLLAIVGLCAILGILTRNTEQDKDRDNASNTLIRGFGTLLAIFAALTAVGVVIYLISLVF